MGLVLVVDDYNICVEVVVFVNNSSYVNYFLFLFGNIIDNGG